jgi:hypothetical protein
MLFRKRTIFPPSPPSVCEASPSSTFSSLSLQHQILFTSPS